MTQIADWLDRQEIDGGRAVIGIDEAGRGCLAGPVYASALLASPALFRCGVRDSKALSAKKRDEIADFLRVNCNFAVGMATPREIERLNIRKASELAMLRAFSLLALRHEKLLRDPLIIVDGNHAPDFGVACKTAIKGDATHITVAAASIMAKTARDAYMHMLGEEFPGYAWGVNAGYPTKRHKEALATFGVTPHHRATYGPVKAIASVQ